MLSIDRTGQSVGILCPDQNNQQNKSIMKALAQVKGWLQDWTGKNEIEVELSGSERVQQVAVAGVTVPCLAYVGEKEVNVCAFNDSDANALLR